MPTSPDAITVNETVGRAITGINKDAAPLGHRPTEQQIRQARANKAIVEHNKTKAAERTVHQMERAWSDGDTGSPEVPSGDKAKEVIDRINPTTDSAKNVRTMATDRAYRNLMAEGPDAVARLTSEPAFTDASVIEPIRALMLQVPELKIIADQIGEGALTPEMRADWINFLTDQIDDGRLIGEDRFIDNFKKKYADFINKDRPKVDADEQTKSLKKEEGRLDKQLKYKEVQFLGLGDKIDDNQKQQESYASEDPAEEGGKLKELKKRIDAGEDDFKKGKRELKALEDELADKRNTRDRIQAGKDSPSLEGRLSELDKATAELIRNIGEKQAGLDPHQKLIDKHAAEVAVKAGLGQAREQLFADEARVGAEVDTLRAQLSSVKSRMSDLDSAKGTSPEDIEKGMQDIITSAFKETMLARAAKERAAITGMLTEIIAKEADPHAKFILDRVKGYNDRWSTWEKKYGPFGAKEVKEFQKDTAKKDLNALMAEGPEGLIHSMLNGELDPETGSMYSVNKIDRLLNDKDFMDKTSPPAVASLLRQSYTNGLITPSMLETLEDSEWGKSALEHAIKWDEDHGKHMGRNLKEHGFSSISDAIKKKKGLGALLILTLLFPAAGVGVLGFKMAKSSLEKGGDKHAEPEKKAAH